MLHDVPEVFYWIQARWTGWPGLNLILNWNTPAMGSKTILFLAAERPTQHLQTLPPPSHVLSLNLPSARAPKAKAPFVDAGPSWHRHGFCQKQTPWRWQFWVEMCTESPAGGHFEGLWLCISWFRAVLVVRAPPEQLGKGGGAVQLLVCLLFWRYRSRT